MKATPKRLPMRLWIKKKLDEGAYPEMKWLDKEEGKFQVSWKHGSRQDWHYTDVRVFRDWALYTGKLNPDTNPFDANTIRRWKTNFRCALNSLPEIEQVRNESDGKGKNARKVYIFRRQAATKSKSRKLKEHRKQLVAAKRTELEPDDRQIIEIVDEMCWSPLLIQQSPKADAELTQVRDLLEKDQTPYQPVWMTWPPYPIGAC
ncbi:interferon regulatory factor 2 [Exaiptasia diaphana]|uniref:IRF tryptophan pentad repeat domain-containing protein n=1 Tax=Exaiptasia diaphana TaxID=2652724 RepID=A0A913XZN8_EXADI|nr:interferon regulatory factor 2 [Exaiptasia diaphana]KXJ23449.1 Interferon regulatory factor 2 [Exaiptasia diaphana]